MSGHEQMVERLAEDLGGRYVNLTQSFTKYSGVVSGVAVVTKWSLCIAPGLRGEQCQFFDGDSAGICVARCREAMQTKDRADIKERRTDRHPQGCSCGDPNCQEFMATQM